MQKMHKSFGAKVHGFTTKITPKKITKKFVPATIILAKSLTGLPAQANDFLSPITYSALHYNKTISYLVKDDNSHKAISTPNLLLRIFTQKNRKKQTVPLVLTC